MSTKIQEKELAAFAVESMDAFLRQNPLIAMVMRHPSFSERSKKMRASMIRGYLADQKPPTEELPKYIEILTPVCASLPDTVTATLITLSVLRLSGDKQADADLLVIVRTISQLFTNELRARLINFRKGPNQ